MILKHDSVLEGKFHRRCEGWKFHFSYHEDTEEATEATSIEIDLIEIERIIPWRNGEPDQTWAKQIQRIRDLGKQPHGSAGFGEGFSRKTFA